MIKKSTEWVLRYREARNSGSAAVEMAFVMPVLVVLGLGVADYGALMGLSASLEGATRAGAEYGKLNPSDTSGIEAQICGHLGLTLSGGSCSPVTPGTSPVCTCIDNTLVAPCPPAANTTPCAGKMNNFLTPPQADQRVLQYVSVTATRTFNPLVSYVGFFNGLSLTAETRFRTQ
jgi:hypothetical protein